MPAFFLFSATSARARSRFFVTGWKKACFSPRKAFYGPPGWI